MTMKFSESSIYRQSRLVQVKVDIARKYEMRDLGEAHWFLVMEITHDQVAQTISIDQRQYIRKILGHFGLDKVQLVSTPMATNLKLPKMESPTIDQCMYQSMLGSLMYTAIGTRPDIMFTIHYLSQHSIAPGEKHLNVMKCIYHYLNRTLDLGLLFYRNQFNCNLVSFSDLDWAGDPNTQRLVSGYTFLFCGAVIAWSAKKQPTIALSSTEAKYMAMTHSGKEVVFLNHLFNDLEIPIQLPISLLVDNQSAIALAENPIFHACSKHIEVCHHWMHEKTGDRTIQLEYVPTVDQVADIFTKLLNSEKFRKFCDALGLVRISAC